MIFLGVKKLQLYVSFSFFKDFSDNDLFDSAILQFDSAILFCHFFWNKIKYFVSPDNSNSQK